MVEGFSLFARIYDHKKIIMENKQLRDTDKVSS